MDHTAARERMVKQLAEDGRLVIPIGDAFSQELKRIRKKHGDLYTDNLGGCRFVKLLGEYGWKA
jgi:protein-L-isoaspartate(D-aspartate) O-methyltransferase